MKLISALLLVLILSAVALSQQTKFEFVRDYDFAGRVKDSIVAYKYLYQEDEILLIGRRSVRKMDAISGRVLDDRVLDIEEYGEDSPRLISPDNRRMIVFGNYSFNDSNNKIKRVATVWDLETCKPVAVIDTTKKPVQSAQWSYDGRVLATSSEPSFVINFEKLAVDISFLDGHTFALKSTLPAEKINWMHLSDDGSKALYSTVIPSKGFFLKLGGLRSGPINVFDTEKGVVEETLAPSPNSLLDATQEIGVTPDVRHLVYFAYKDKGGKDEDRRLVIRRLEQPGKPGLDLTLLHEIPPAPKLPGYGLSFSGDGKYLAFDSGKTLKIYDIASGRQAYELAKDDRPDYWMNDNKVLLYNYGKKLDARDITNGNLLYSLQLIYEEFSDSESYWVGDHTTIVAHKDGKMFLAYSEQYVRIYDSATGALRQTLIQPPFDFSLPIDPKKGPRLSGKRILSKAHWSPDGKGLYVIGPDNGSVTLFRAVTKSDS